MPEEAPKIEPREPLSMWEIAGWGLAVYAGTRLAAVFLEATSMAAAVAQAVIAEWGSGRLGIVWTESAPKDPPPAGAAMAKRAAFGGAIGLAMAAVTAGVLAVTGGVILDRAASALSVIGISLLTAILYAMRDELVLHGILLRAIDAGDAKGATTRDAVKVVACGVTSAAAAVGDGLGPRAIAVQGILGLVFGALWVRDRGAWPAWGANTAFRFGTDLLFAGGLYEARVATTSWGGGDAGALGGTAALLALAPFGAAAVSWAARRPR